jgi:hypothetical protein
MSLYSASNPTPFSSLTVDQLAPHILNANTLKRMTEDLAAGIDFCKSLEKATTDTCNYILKKTGGKKLSISAPADVQLPNGNSPRASPKGTPKSSQAPSPIPTNSSSADGGSTSATSSSTATSSRKGGAAEKQTAALESDDATLAAAAALDPQIGSSTYRRNRKSKIPPSLPASTVVDAQIKQLKHDADRAYLECSDPKGNRVLTKKEISYRAFELSRYRDLVPGDFVATRMSSQELLILTKVLQPWTQPDDVPVVNLLKMPEAKRKQQMGVVSLIDADEHSDVPPVPITIPRVDVMTLPKNHLEAAMWGQRYKKGMRVWAMYTKTTTFYPGTVVDHSTYCRGDDDIVVVEFDGDEEGFILPQRHIPARFVTLIGNEDPLSKPLRKMPVSTAQQLAVGAVPAAAPTEAPAPKKRSRAPTGKRKK